MMRRTTVIGGIGILSMMLLFLPRAEAASDDGRGGDKYIGSKKCSMCHSKQRTAFRAHGHPKVFRPVIEGRMPGELDVHTPEGMTWDDVSYLVGGAKSYARFLDKQGFVVTGDRAQWSFYGKRLTAFKKDIPRGKLKYGCVKCHSVGWKESGSYEKGVKNTLPGIPGVWFENSVGCESCHGPGRQHFELDNKRAIKGEGGDLKIVIDRSVEACGTCHNRNSDNSINIVATDLLQSRQQYSELMRSLKGKKNMTCASCHDPHSSSSTSSGFRLRCISCHEKKEIKAESMAHLECIDCHMPLAVRGAYDVKTDNYHRGDTRSHIFGISSDPEYAIADGTKHAVPGKDGLVRLTVEMACYPCHQSGEAEDMTRHELLGTMKSIHR